ncbi:MAG: EAL domain-containing protein [Desulfonauticus sp.]|nr:EAL domain-containing protein [Desulfonauticus sp.]
MKNQVKIFKNRIIDFKLQLYDLVFNTSIKSKKVVFNKICKFIQNFLNLRSVSLYYFNLEEKDIHLINFKSTGNGYLRDLYKTYLANKEFDNSIIESLNKGDVFSLVCKVELDSEKKDCRKIFLPILNKNQGNSYFFVFTFLDEEFTNLHNSFDIFNFFKEIQSDLVFVFNYIEEEINHAIILEALENSLDWVLITDRHGKIIYINKSVEEITGYSKQELLGKNPRILKSGYHDQKFYEEFWQTILSGKIYHGIFIDKKKNGDIFYSQKRVIPIKIDGTIQYFVAFGKDITYERSLQDEINKSKYFDQLTGLNNFVGFQMQVIKALAEQSVKDRPGLCGILIFDIYDFTSINRAYGFEVGDKILKILAVRLKNSFKSYDIICRVAGDSFAVFIRDLSKRDYVVSIIDRVMRVLIKPILIDEERIILDFNAGAAIYPTDAKDFSQLYENASLSLARARKEGSGVYKIFDAEMDVLARKRILAENILTRAIEENGFIFHYQPYFKATNLELAGYEALVRIKTKEGKIIYPGDFIDVLEEKRFITYFQDWSLKYFKTVLNLEEIEKLNIRISFNISASSFHDTNFMDRLFEFCLEYGHLFTLEITERLLVQDVNITLAILNRFREKTKVFIAVDDFGTGYSSLSYLANLPLDILKIDMSFVKKMLMQPKNASIVESIIYLAEKIGLKTIAEGVEKTQELEMLKRFGCDYVQGFLLAKPQPLEDIKLSFKTEVR